MNSTTRIVITLSLITATALSNAARMEDVLDIPKPDIQETQQQTDAGYQVKDVRDVRLTTRSYDEQRTLKDRPVYTRESSTSKQQITPINPQFPR